MHHHLLIRTLLIHYQLLRQEIAELQAAQEDSQAQISRTASKLSTAQRELDSAQAQARRDESDRYARESDRDGALKDLENARRYHDSWAEARALKRLKRL